MVGYHDRATIVEVERPVTGPHREGGRGVDAATLHRDAVAIWRLLASLDADDHRTRARLLEARLEVRATSARMWRERGWPSITDDGRSER